MSWALNTRVGTKGDRDAATRKLILVGYGNHAHKNGRNAWASKVTIAEYADCDTRTVQRQVKRLVADGWIREGDQEQVAHIRADRRPVVYDLAMNDEVRAQWAAAAAAGDSSWTSEQRGDPWWGRGDNLSPRPVGHDHAASTTADTPRGDTTLSPRPAGHGVTDGVTPSTSRGDTAMSPKPSRTTRTTPQPPPAGEPATAATSTESALPCPRHGATRSPGCRGCGTTPRQVEAARRRAETEQRRADDLDQIRREREARQAARAAGPNPAVTSAIEATRRNLAARRTS